MFYMWFFKHYMFSYTSVCILHRLTFLFKKKRSTCLAPGQAMGPDALAELFYIGGCSPGRPEGLHMALTSKVAPLGFP